MATLCLQRIERMKRIDKGRRLGAILLNRVWVSFIFLFLLYSTFVLTDNVAQKYEQCIYSQQ